MGWLPRSGSHTAAAPRPSSRPSIPPVPIWDAGCASVCGLLSLVPIIFWEIEGPAVPHECRIALLALLPDLGMDVDGDAWREGDDSDTGGPPAQGWYVEI
ncbi:hypothetical protein F751_6523 [Auxenochlorella protothecoides]|uniref:Uncharacterized protein n=1 Tax=Auxenochlorella protothecoides TaxID=3075 RepID=A0A087STF0_AUXPR|nr:hypothetical protein F751_6523 [Auxenochlorella protothecoides]KFM29004.1 hypothetical protein F751_6523 [Auxenochlorella protothecoides]